MKKILSAALAVLFICFAAFPCTAMAKQAVISALFNDELEGMSDADCRKFADLSGGDLVMQDDRVWVYDYTNMPYFDKMKPGRTYYVEFEFLKADGCEFPEELTKENVDFRCGEHNEIVWYHYAGSSKEPHKVLYVCEKVVIDGNIFQRLFGRIADFFLKVRAWSPY